MLASDFRYMAVTTITVGRWLHDTIKESASDCDLTTHKETTMSDQSQRTNVAKRRLNRASRSHAAVSGRSREGQRWPLQRDLRATVLRKPKLPRPHLNRRNLPMGLAGAVQQFGQNRSSGCKARVGGADEHGSSCGPARDGRSRAADAEAVEKRASNGGEVVAAGFSNEAYPGAHSAREHRRLGC